MRQPYKVTPSPEARQMGVWTMRFVFAIVGLTIFGMWLKLFVFGWVLAGLFSCGL